MKLVNWPEPGDRIIGGSFSNLSTEARVATKEDRNGKEPRIMPAKHESGIVFDVAIFDPWDKTLTQGDMVKWNEDEECWEMI